MTNSAKTICAPIGIHRKPDLPCSPRRIWKRPVIRPYLKSSGVIVHETISGVIPACYAPFMHLLCTCFETDSDGKESPSRLRKHPKRQEKIAAGRWFAD